jgi:uncharacterized YigZ family protein
MRIAVGSSEAEHRVKGSRFIATASPAPELDSAAEARRAERRRFHDASHHAYAVRLHDGTEKLDDDGEPSGTAGRPILAAIQGADLLDVVVVVTRYFGGTKLGKGGLARAYAAAADGALSGMRFQEVVSGRRVRLSHAYADTGAVARSIEECGANRLGERYGETVELELAVPASRVDRLRAGVAEATGGRVDFEELPDEMLLPSDT